MKLTAETRSFFLLNILENLGVILKIYYRWERTHPRRATPWLRGVKVLT